MLATFNAFISQEPTKVTINSQPMWRVNCGVLSPRLSKETQWVTVMISPSTSGWAFKNLEEGKVKKGWRLFVTGTLGIKLYDGKKGATINATLWADRADVVVDSKNEEAKTQTASSNQINEDDIPF